MPKTQSTARLAVLALFLLVLAEPALAGTGGAFLDGLKQFLVDSMEGTLGAVIGISGLLYGLFGGVMKGSLGGAGVGFGLAAGSYYGPAIISQMSMMTLQSL
ncbi:MAG: hypothetical protein OEL20_05425 [Sulfuritalea sp.]|nr:hypothetical protein [Sulfuritalea sp.]